MSRKKIIVLILIIVIGGFAYYAISPLWKVVEVNDEMPDNLITSPAIENQIPIDPTELAEMSELDSPLLEGGESDAGDIPVSSLPNTSGLADETSMLNDLPTEPSLPEMYPIIDTTAHPAEGTVSVLRTTDGVVLRYQDFETINGPNLHVYLANDLKAEGFIDLGPIRGTKGNINYSVPENIDIDDYKYVMYWCVPFGVLFNYAEIN